MFPLVGGLVAGGASLLGSIFSSDTSAQNTQAQIAAQEQMQNQTEQFNAGQAQINRDYQTQMSNTAYQRASADMKAAGLNPMMMFGSGGAASSPSGATASVGTPSVPMPTRTSPLAGLGDAVGKIFSTANMVQDYSNKNTEQSLMASRDNQVKSETHNTELDSINKAKTGQLIDEQTAKTAAEKIIKQQEETDAKNRALTSANQLDMNPTARAAADRAAYYGKSAGEVTKPAMDVVNTLTSTALKKRGLDMLQERGAKSDAQADLDRAASRWQERYDKAGNPTGSTRSWTQY